VTSKQRILAAWSGRPQDYAPLTTWCFGVSPPQRLRWKKNCREVKYWYSKRMEHIHTTSESWDLEDDFRRVRAWQSLGVDDILDVSVPWSIDPEVTWEDSKIPAAKADRYPALARLYQTPSGTLRHIVRLTEPPEPGWVIQPDYVPLLDDLNIPRAIEHAVADPKDVPIVKHLYCPPGEREQNWVADRMKEVKQFADEANVAVQAWSAFGMDAVVWLAGTEGAIMMAMDAPEEFGRLVDIIHETDVARTELAASTAGVDMVVERGWYSSTDFWSPKLFDRFMFPKILELASIAHKYDKKFCYVMTTGVETLGGRLVNAGVDVLYFLDPLLDAITVEKARELFEGRMTLAGGINALSLAGECQLIREQVKRALDVLSSTKRFILHPGDALFPDTPWKGVEELIEAWKEYR